MISQYNLLGRQFEFEVHDQDELTSNIIKKYGCNIDMEAVYAYNYLLRKGDYFLDIGANMGWQTVFASHAVGDTGRVYAFEPDDRNFQLLENNIRRNNLNNVSAVKQALAEDEYVGELYNSNQNFGNHMLNPKYLNTKVHDQHYSVSVTTIDNFLEKADIDLSKITLVKIDVEGSEPRVLSGGRKFFSQHNPSIILEYSPSQIKQCGNSVFDIFSFIDQHNYSLYQIEKIDINRPEYRIKLLNFADLLNLTQSIMNTTEYRDLLLLSNN